MYRLVIGTRPEAIKLAPVAHALAERAALRRRWSSPASTGLDPAEFGLGDYPRLRARLPRRRKPARACRQSDGRAAPAPAPSARPAGRAGRHVERARAALAAFAAGVPVAHVEAGLRTHDPLLPWPEEEYRTAIDARADLLFAPTPSGRGQPARGRASGRNPRDRQYRHRRAVEAAARLPPPSACASSGAPRILVTCHRRESWGEGLAIDRRGADRARARRRGRIDVCFIPTRMSRRRWPSCSTAIRGISLIAPCSHGELVGRMREADLVLSDSGGIQEEAPALGTPLLVLRDKTERPEAWQAATPCWSALRPSAIVARGPAPARRPARRARRWRRRAFPLATDAPHRASRRSSSGLRSQLARLGRVAGL